MPLPGWQYLGASVHRYLQKKSGYKKAYIKALKTKQELLNILHNVNLLSKHGIALCEYQGTK